MVAEAWIVRMGNLKHALLQKSSKQEHNKQTVGILSFEVAAVMSKTVNLHKSLSDTEISRLRSEIFKAEGVSTLVSPIESRLLALALAEKLQDLDCVAGVVSRLGRKCTVPALQRFEHVYRDVVGGVIDVRALGFLVKDMEGTVRKMERYAHTTSNLYARMEVLNETERAWKKLQHQQQKNNVREECRLSALEQKLVWQKQDVRHLQQVSLWDQTFDKVLELLARTVCTIYARICVVFGESQPQSNDLEDSSPETEGGGRVHTVSPPLLFDRVHHTKKTRAYHNNDEQIAVARNRGANSRPPPPPTPTPPGLHLQGLSSGGVSPYLLEDFRVPCGTMPGKLFLECLNLSTLHSKMDDDFDVHEVGYGQGLGCFWAANEVKREHPRYFAGCNHRSQLGVLFSPDQRQSYCCTTNGAMFGRGSRLAAFASPRTVGGSALASHYANIIIVVEKLLRYPYLVGEETKDDLYQMLPTSLRMSLRANLKAYVKNLAIYDAPLARDWKETLDGILSWLAPLAHDMIRWQSDRNYEQQQIVAGTNVLLLQTLYFADREKTEAAICKLLVGLTYICRYEHQQNALLDCGSSFYFDDCTDWQL